MPFPASLKANKSFDVMFGKKKVEDGILEVPVELANEDLIVGGNNEEEKEGEEEKEIEGDYKSNIPVQARCMLYNIDRNEFITFQKYLLNNGDVGYVSLRGEFYRSYDVCSKHHHGEGSKDAHADYCK